MDFSVFEGMSVCQRRRCKFFDKIAQIDPQQPSYFLKAVLLLLDPAAHEWERRIAGQCEDYIAVRPEPIPAELVFDGLLELDECPRFVFSGWGSPTPTRCPSESETIALSLTRSNARR